MKRVFIIALCSILVHSLNAQEMFAGGSGDGYAEASLPLQVLTSVTEGTGSFALYPSAGRPGTQVDLPSHIRAAGIAVRDAGGRVVQAFGPLSEGFRIPELPAGCYFVTIRTNDGRILYSRLIVQPW